MYGGITKQTDGVTTQNLPYNAKYDIRHGRHSSISFHFFGQDGKANKDTLVMTGVAPQLSIDEWVPLKYAKKHIPSNMLEKHIRQAYNRNDRFLIILDNDTMYSDNTSPITTRLKEAAHKQVTEKETANFQHALATMHRKTQRGACYRTCINHNEPGPTLEACLQHCKKIYTGTDCNEALTVRYRQIELESVIEHAQVQTMLLLNHKSKATLLQSDTLIMLPQSKDLMDQLSHMGIIPNPIGL